MLLSPSPVSAYIISGSFQLITKPDTPSEGIYEFRFVHESPPLVDLKIPAAGVPAKMISGFVGWNAIRSARPIPVVFSDPVKLFVGPTRLHAPVAVAFGAACD